MSRERNDEDFRRSIIKDLEKTGFPTEIVSAARMQERGWFIVHNPSYLDEKSREFDIQAFRQNKQEFGGKQLRVSIYLIVECKKSADKPWVFFTTREDYGRVASPNVIKCASSIDKVFAEHQSTQGAWIPYEALRNFHHYFKLDRRARTYHEAFKDTGQQIYTAITSVTNAVLFRLREYRGVRLMEHSLTLYYPVIIFNGRLFEATVSTNMQISVEETNYLQLSYNYSERPSKTSSSAEQRHRFVVDVVQEKYLTEYLVMIEGELEDLVQLLAGALGMTS